MTRGTPLLLTAVALAGCEVGPAVPAGVRPFSASLFGRSDPVLRYDKDTVIGARFVVPDDVKRIEIGRGVTVTGSFYVQGTRTTELTIAGDDRKTSRIRGTGSLEWLTVDSEASREHSAVYNASVEFVHVMHLTSIDPDRFHVFGARPTPGESIGPIHLEDCDLLETREIGRTDGVTGADGTIVRDVYIDTWDDGIKIYANDMLIEDVTIVHRSNGAPIQLGWSTEQGDAVIRNLTIIAGAPAKPYHMGVFSRAGTDPGEWSSTLDVEGLRIKVPSGMAEPPLFQWGYVPEASVREGDRIDNYTLTMNGLCATPEGRARFEDRSSWIAYEDSVMRIDAPDCSALR